MSAIQSDRRFTTASIVGVGLVLALVLTYVFSTQVGEAGLNWVIDVADVLGAAVCTALCFILWRAADPGEDLRRVWQLLGIGLMLWTLAEIFFLVTELFLHMETPDVSLADLLWVPAYVPIVAAFWLRFRLLRVELARGQWIALLGALVILGVVSTIYVVLPNLPGAGDMQTATGLAGLALGILYPLGDLLMALGAGLALIAMLGGRFSRAWLLVALGCLAIGLADSMYYAGLASGIYSKDLPMTWFTATSDISYFAGYVLIALGLFSQAMLQRAI